ncbi:MAG TPA: glutamate 5-kinase [Nitrospiria bacterium]|nr:glutamate 5-kinase [Nitrospiria bacterium]
MDANSGTLIQAVKRFVVKIGSSLIASRDHGLDPHRLEALAHEMAHLQRQGHEIVIVSSGAILSGLEKLGIKQRPKSLPVKQAAAAVGQSRLIWAYEKAFEAQGLKVAQVLLTQEDLADRKRFLNSRNTLTTLLEYGVIPVINENDTVAVEEIRFGDNDNLAGLVTHLIDAQLLVILSDVEGLFTDDPRLHPDARLIPVVNQVDSETERLARDTTTREGTGGMRSKVQTARDVATYGVPTVIASGRKSGVLTEILKGNPVGTLFLPSRGRRNSRKHWIAFTSRTKGRLSLDAGAVEALTAKGKSLLPSGIVRVEGRFQAGDAVTCIDSKGREVAKGLVNYSSDHVEKIKGAKTAEIAKILGRNDYDEVIHRDNLVIL